MILHEHAPIRDRFRSLVDGLGIEPALPAAYEDFWGEKAFRRRIKSVPREEAGKVYIHYEFEFSRNAVALMEQRLIPAVANAQLKGFLADALAQMKRHLMHIGMYRNGAVADHGMEGVSSHPH